MAACVSPRTSHTSSPLDSSSGLFCGMQKVFNAISLLTFIAVGAQVVGVVYVVSNQDSIKRAIINKAVTAVMDNISLPGLGGDLPIDAPIPSVMPEATAAPEVGAPSVRMFMP